MFEDLEEGIQLHGKLCCEVVVGFEEIVTAGEECCRWVEKGGNNDGTTMNMFRIDMDSDT